MIRKVFSKIRHATSNMTFLWLVYHLTGSLLKMTVTGILERLLPLILGPLIRPYAAHPRACRDRLFSRGCMWSLRAMRERRWRTFSVSCCLNRASRYRAMVAIDEIRAGLLLALPTFSPLGCVSFGWLYLSAFAPATARGAAK